MTWQRFCFEPLDTLFFRDGRPFDQNDDGMADAVSVFPPNPSVLIGALRAAAARGRGWVDGTDWCGSAAEDGTSIDTVLGNGPNDLGQLSFSAPILLRSDRQNGDRWERLYLAPSHVVEKQSAVGDSVEYRLLAPKMNRRLDCDIGAGVALPHVSERGFGLHDGVLWLDHAGMQAVLEGRPPMPDNTVPQTLIYQLERRIGLARDNDRRSARRGQLYVMSKLRFGDRDERFALGIDVSGLPTGKVDWHPKGLHPIGGKRRLVEVTAIDGASGHSLRKAPQAAGGLYTIVLTGPALMPATASWNEVDGEIPGMPGRIVSACIGRPRGIGGWDGRKTDTGSLGATAMTFALEAGSTWFMALAPEETLDDLPQALGERGRAGFGEFAVGQWPQGDLQS